MATLATVARRAGVSLATASRVVNGSDKQVSEELRQRVLKAVADLQYVPNAHAQSLARSDRSVVGVIVHDVSDPYFAEITRGLQQVATEHGRLLIICNSYRDPDKELEYVEMLRGHQVAAIVLAGSGYHNPRFTRELSAKLKAYARSGGRVAVIGRHDLSDAAVMPANQAGGYAIGSEVYRLGHARVGVIAGPKVLTTTSDRLAGLRLAARGYARALPARRVVYADFDRDSGAAATHRLLDEHPNLTAIVALNDVMAIGALAVLRNQGISVPTDITVTGFDDMPIARDVTPALTTVHLPLADMGAHALRLALESTPPPPNIRLTVAATLVRRDSSGPPPGQAAGRIVR